MYFKLAIKNVRKSFQDFLIYFLTLAFAVCLFYTFNSFQAQQAVLEMNQSQLYIIDALSLAMRSLSSFVAVVLAFLILYANHFLMKRRKKELGLYMLLGMPKHKISTVLTYETCVIGLMSLLAGMFAGLLLSQILTVVTATLFEVKLNYSFVFSMNATWITLFAFSMIFVIAMVLNTLALHTYELIDLLHAQQKNAEFRIKKQWISISIFMLSILLLGGTYYFSFQNTMNAFLNLGPFILAGSVGTLLFFLSLAGIFLALVQSSKNIYFRNLNCFVLRQMNANINANYVSMSIVCIMLLLSIGALSTGLSINSAYNLKAKNDTPYDFTHHSEIYTAYQKEKKTYVPTNAEELLTTLKLDQNYMQETYLVRIYDSLISPDIAAFVDQVSRKYKTFFTDNYFYRIKAIRKSDYNHELKARGYDPIHIQKNEVYLYANAEIMREPLQQILKAHPTISLYGKDHTIVNEEYISIPIGTTNVKSSDPMILVVDDQSIPEDAPVMSIYYSINHSDAISDQAFAEYFQSKLQEVNLTLPEDQFFQTISSFNANKIEVLESSKGNGIIFTYIGLYLGIVFLIASAVILALQQLSQANENKQRYRILHQIGTDTHMMHRSILLQIAIYFLLPLLLAIAHSYVGIHVVNIMVVSFGKADIMASSILTAGVILCIYGLYFLITYTGYKKIVKQ